MPCALRAKAEKGMPNRRDERAFKHDSTKNPTECAAQTPSGQKTSVRNKPVFLRHYPRNSLTQRR